MGVLSLVLSDVLTGKQNSGEPRFSDGISDIIAAAKMETKIEKRMMDLDRLNFFEHPDQRRDPHTAVMERTPMRMPV